MRTVLCALWVQDNDTEAVLQAMCSVLSDLGGLRVVSATDERVVVAITTLEGPGDDAVGGLVSAVKPRVAEHTLAVELHGRAPVGVTLTPPTVDVAPALEVARGDARGTQLLVQRVMEALAQGR